jgi:hypothetical protein
MSGNGVDKINEGYERRNKGAVVQEDFLNGKGKRVTGLTGESCCCGLDVRKWGKDER